MSNSNSIKEILHAQQVVFRCINICALKEHECKSKIINLLMVKDGEPLTKDEVAKINDLKAKAKDFDEKENLLISHLDKFTDEALEKWKDEVSTLPENLKIAIGNVQAIGKTINDSIDTLDATLDIITGIESAVTSVVDILDII